MNSAVFSLLLAAVAAPPVEVSLLDGSTRTGELQAIEEAAIVLSASGSETTIDREQVLELRPQNPAEPSADSSASVIRLQLLDGTRLDVSQVATSRNRKMSIETAGMGQFTVPLTNVGSLRFGAADDAVRESWEELTARELKRDLLVIRKDDVLDFLDGIVASVDAKEVRFLLDGNEVPVPRSKVYGIVYSRRARQTQRPVCEIHLPGSQLLRVAQLGWNDGKLQAELLSGGELTIPLEQTSRLDFSLGKVQFLAAMEPVLEEYSDWFIDVAAKELQIALTPQQRQIDAATWRNRFRRNVNLDSQPLSIQGKTYARGVCIHSGTRLAWKTGRDYSRFQAVMGIDYQLARRGLGFVHVVILGDGKPLYEADVTPTDEARELDLDISDVRQLEIRVEFGEDLDIGDHLTLAEARVIR